MDDLIPILIVIAISIVGALTRKKRKRVVPENIINSPQNSKKEDLFSWLEKFTEEEEQVIPYSEPVSQVQNTATPIKTEPIQKSHNKIFSQNAGFITPEEKQLLAEKEEQRIIDKQSVESSQATNMKMNYKKDKLKNNFNLKKAVIYAEILNRKYN